MPLILFGPRQVGKTYLLLDFGKRFYKKYIYVNFEIDSETSSYFKSDLQPKEIIKKLELKFSTIIEPENTLIIFDEIQNCDRALTSLKYFSEFAPEYDIVAAGSLLGVALKNKEFSFPVGKVEIMHLHPFTFEEFLMALNKEKFIDEIKECYLNNKECVFHETLLDFYKKYLIIGGMPSAILRYLENDHILLVADMQRLILDSYVADMIKYTTENELVKIKACFNSIPVQLAKENKKFQYKLVQEGGLSTIYGTSIEWLVNAGIAIKCVRVSTCKMPLRAYQEIQNFKLYMMDTGLLLTHSRFNSSLIFSDIDNSFVGFVNENYIAQTLNSNNADLFYWTHGETEIDFVIQDKKGNIIPIEIKSGKNVKSKSLNEFIKNLLLLIQYGYHQEILNLQIVLSRFHYMQHFVLFR